MRIKPTSRASGSIFDVHESAEDILLYPVNDEVPCPWDADISAKNGKIYLSGSLGPSGPNGALCNCEVPVDDFNKYYILEVPDYDEELFIALQEAGWSN